MTDVLVRTRAYSLVDKERLIQSCFVDFVGKVVSLYLLLLPALSPVSSCHVIIKTGNAVRGHTDLHL